MMPHPARFTLAAAVLAAAAPPLPAQGAERVAGEWFGALKLEIPFRVVFRFDSGAAGLRGSADFPDQGARGVALTEVRVAGDSVHVALRAGGIRFDGRVSARADSIVGVFAQGDQRLPLTLARLTGADRQAMTRPQEPRGPRPYAEQAVTVTRGAVVLAGTLTRPTGGGRRPALVLVAGSGPLDRDAAVAGHRPFWVLADHLTRAGYVVLRLDKRGVGRSTGDFASATTHDLSADAGAAVAFLRAHEGVDITRVGLLGHSEGALVAALAADRADVAFAILLAPPGVRGDTLMLDRAAHLFRARGVPDSAIEKDAALRRALFAAVVAPGDSVAARARVRIGVARALARMTRADFAALGYGPDAWDAGAETFLAQLTWFRAWLPYDPAPAYARVRGPVLAVFGEKDVQVPPSVNEAPVRRALSRQARGDATTVVLPGLNHLMQDAATGSPAEYGQIAQTWSPALLAILERWLGQHVMR